MPPKEDEKIVECNTTVTSKLLDFLKCLGATNIEELIEKYKIICSIKKNRIDIFVSHKDLQSSIISDSIIPYVTGVHVAVIKKNKLLPYLGLLSFLKVNNIEIKKSYVVVSEEGEKLFLYGRDIFPQSVLKIENPPYNCPKIVVVMNTQDDLLGWGYLIKRRSNQFLIKNLIDAGWYLRSGV